VQSGMYGRNLGELVLVFDGGKLTVESYKLIPIDDTIAGDKAIAGEIERFKPAVNAALFTSRGYSIDQPLCRLAQDVPNTFADIAASTPLSNLITDAFRKATHAEIGLSVNGTARAGLTKGKSGVQTVYDIFAVAPLGAGVLDPTAGSTLVTGYFSAPDLKNILEFFLVDSPAHPGDYFPRCSGMRFRYDTRRPVFDVVTAIELGDLDRGYSAIDISGKDGRLYSVTCSLYLGKFLVSIPKITKGKLTLVPKNKAGQPLKSKVEALDMPRGTTPDLLPPGATLDNDSVATTTANGAVREIKEWQAIMDYLRSLPAQPSELPVLVIDDRGREVRAIKVG
jgi:5'-nucleotidase/UDP-sugar diphosphatase